LLLLLLLLLAEMWLLLLPVFISIRVRETQLEDSLAKQIRAGMQTAKSTHVA